MDLRIQYTTLLERQLAEQKALIKMLEKGKLGAKERQTVLDTLKQLTNSIDQRRSSIKALEREVEISERRMAKVLGILNWEIQDVTSWTRIPGSKLYMDMEHPMWEKMDFLVTNSDRKFRVSNKHISTMILITGVITNE